MRIETTVTTETILAALDATAEPFVALPLQEALYPRQAIDAALAVFPESFAVRTRSDGEVGAEISRPHLADVLDHLLVAALRRLEAEAAGGKTGEAERR